MRDEIKDLRVFSSMTRTFVLKAVYFVVEQSCSVQDASAAFLLAQRPPGFAPAGRRALLLQKGTRKLWEAKFRCCLVRRDK